MNSAPQTLCLPGWLPQDFQEVGAHGVVRGIPMASVFKVLGVPNKLVRLWRGSVGCKQAKSAQVMKGKGKWRDPEMLPKCWAFGSSWRLSLGIRSVFGGVLEAGMKSNVMTLTIEIAFQVWERVGPLQ